MQYSFVFFFSYYITYSVIFFHTLNNNTVNGLFQFKQLPEEIKTWPIKQYLDYDEKIKLYLAIPKKENNIFTDVFNFIDYWIYLIRSNDNIKNLNMMLYSKKINIDLALTNDQKLKILKESTQFLNFEVFKYLFENLNAADTNIRTLVASTIKHTSLNEQQKSIQFDIIKLLLNNNFEVSKESINHYYSDIFYTMNFPLIEFLINNLILNLNEYSLGSPKWFRVIYTCNDHKESSYLNQNRIDFFANVFKFVLTKVVNLKLRNYRGIDITGLIKEVIKDETTKVIFLNLVKGIVFFNIRKRS